MYMDHSTASQHHHQEMSSQTLESMLVCTKAQQEKKARPIEETLKCPRCDSTNTKFCYYNNYSLSQPRYFCKSCRRYWTKGGTLRNVPVGGGCRKNKRSSSNSSSSSPKIRGQDQAIVTNPNNPLLSSYNSSDISIALARLQKQTNGHHLGFDHQNIDHFPISGNPNNNNPHGPGLIDALRGGFLETPINGFNNLYYGGMNNGNNMGNHHYHVENGGGGIGMKVSSDEMGLAYEDKIGDSTTIVKQEMCNARSGGGEERVLWGFPWQINGEGNNMGDLDPSRQSSWNGFGSTWHALLNSPLM